MFNKKHKIGDTIAKLRKEKGLTQIELAEKLQVSDKAVSKWESNKGDPSLEFLPAIAELFDVTLDFLMTGKEQKEKIVTMSKLELCAKNDDVKLYKEIGKDIKYKDENDKTIFDYIFKYESKELFKSLLPNAEHYISGHSVEFYENFYYMRILCNDVSVVRDLIRLEYINTTLNNHIEETYKRHIGYNGSQLITIPRKIISDRIIDLILYDKNTDNSIKNAMLSNNDVKGWISPALSYSYFVFYAAKNNDFKFIKELLENAVKMNKENAEIDTQWRSGIYLGFVDLPKELFDILLENEKYDLIDLANENNMVYKAKYINNSLYKDIFVLSSYEIEANKIKFNKKLSEKEKKLLYCIHDGVVCLDELIALNDFDLYEKTIKKYPISKYEEIYADIKNKNYKKIFDYAVAENQTNLIKDFKTKQVEKLEEDFKSCVYSAKLNEELNSNYLKQFIYNESFGTYNNPTYNTFRKNRESVLPTYENFINAKNYIFLESVLDKDIRFIEKACKAATQEELDAALENIAPNNFKGIGILLKYGAKLHKRWTEDDGWGYMVDRDEFDEIGTELLKKKIKDALGGKL